MGKEQTAPIGTGNDLLIMAGIEIALGMIVLIFPGQTGVVFNTIISLGLIIMGIYCGVMYFRKDDKLNEIQLIMLPVGLTLFTFGAIMAFRPALLNTILGVALGLILLFSGYCTLQLAILFAKRKLARWYLPLIFAVVAVVCGIVVLILQPSSETVAVTFTGIAIIAGGIMLILTKYMINRLERDIEAAALAATEMPEILETAELKVAEIIEEAKEYTEAAVEKVEEMVKGDDIPAE